MRSVKIKGGWGTRVARLLVDGHVKKDDGTKRVVEMPSFDLGTSRMLSGHSTN